MPHLPVPHHPSDLSGLIDTHDRPLALLSVADLRALEVSAAATLPPHELMARAGRAAALFLTGQIASARSSGSAAAVWIVAGPGNNGGDALVVATELHIAGVAVEVCMPVEVKPEDARWALGEARAAGVPISTSAPDSFERYGWLVDGMFGIGLTRPLEGVFATLAQQLSQRAKRQGQRTGARRAERPR